MALINKELLVLCFRMQIANKPCVARKALLTHLLMKPRTLKRLKNIKVNKSSVCQRLA